MVGSTVWHARAVSTMGGAVRGVSNGRHGAGSEPDARHARGVSNGRRGARSEHGGPHARGVSSMGRTREQ
ncbi:hypothetical protein GCM10010912_09000 [Paenibacillus albidus]|uniref:Uncharacterized protein n=1 Tax=Paenibacillus albidus TaxID=2041023 RepID=A0A917FDW9_9BACL|nr:hypothetical protein GCM10010912_09000 [Paenibacillus albidus]